MGFWSGMLRVSKFLTRNPALDFGGGLVIIAAMVTPLWILNGPKPKKLPVEDFDDAE